ncbi:MAG: MCE family protein [Actinomycetota bacterium]|nr:MCE family protein [Actinomycetota bacterium]MDQ5807589.1 MCE family protein [Actinomycetota bacterium]
MQKQAPTLGRLATMVFFALSCFGLLMFLWLAFGGPIPLKPKGYEFRITFPEVSQLATQSDVRVAGVEIGKVVKVDRSPDGKAVIATLEIDRKYAPISADAKAQIRNKTILGQTYVELTLGSKTGERIADGGMLDQRRVGDLVSLDEILNTLDPFTRKSYRTWQQGVSQAITDRGDELNDTIGNLPEFVDSGGDLFEVLDENRQALGALVRNTGVVFGALTEREQQLRRLIENSDTVFTAIQSEREDWAQVWNIFPTFLEESRLTYARLERFARDTRPLVRDLRPAMDDLRPTLIALRDLSPDLERLFKNLDPLIEISKESLPAQREIFEGLRPVFGALGPWLSELNPVLAWLGEHQHTVSDIFANLGVATHARTQSRDPQATGHYLRQFGPTGAETASVHRDRLETNRGNTYINPLSLVGPERAQRGIIDAYDCKNTAAGEGDKPDNSSSPSCYTQAPYQFAGALRKFPHVEREDYGG